MKMNWNISDHEATCEYAGHTFIANRNNAIIMRDGSVVNEKSDNNDIVESMVYCQMWIGHILLTN